MITTFTYITVAIGIIFFLYIIPAFAIFPRFILSPRTAASIPFLSISIIICIQYILSTLNQFNHQNVIILVGILSIIGIYRITKTLSSNINYWKSVDYIALCLITLSSIPLMIILGFDGFQHADEIYSWNLWAKKIYFNQIITFESTQSPYPLALPSFIAFCYKFIGSIDYQLPIKFTFSLIYISTILVIYSFATSKTKVGIFFISYVILMLVIGIGYEYKKVYADTLMGGFLVASLSLLISLSKNQPSLEKISSSTSILVASVLLVCSASLTKQGAMVWSMIFFPLLAYVIINKNINIIKSFKLVLLIPILTPVLWYFVGGKGFNTNTGVIWRSMGERNFFDQLLYGFNESFINHPVLLLFICIVFIVLLKKTNTEKIVLLIGITTSTLLLLLFGAYETTRLFIHMILVGWMIIFAYGEDIISTKIGGSISIIGNSFYTYAVIGLLFIFWSISSFNFKLDYISPVKNILDGREVQANWVLGKNGAEQYREIIQSNMGLWASDSHVWGIYYGIHNFSRGENLSSTNIYDITDEIIRKQIGWIYTRGNNIKRLEDFCINSTTKIVTAENPHNQTLYKISPSILDSCLKKYKHNE